MASLVTQTEIDVFTGDFQNLFDTFKRSITVHKSPKKVISAINTDFLYGYGEASDQANYTYEPVSRDFEAMVQYKDHQEADELGGVSEIRYFAGDLRIKVDEDTKDYIKDGKTEKVTVDGKDFQVMTEESVKYFFGMKLYVFHLQYTS
tara:strand:+ start:6949 stop:7392 length:444 start_codon:yes stop_codon:yes gene_type:complete